MENVQFILFPGCENNKAVDFIQSDFSDPYLGDPPFSQICKYNKILQMAKFIWLASYNFAF